MHVTPRRKDTADVSKELLAMTSKGEGMSAFEPPIETSNSYVVLPGCSTYIPALEKRYLN